jgi:putative membrane protein
VRRTVLLVVPALFALVVPIIGLLACAVAVVTGIAWGRAAHRRAGHGVTPSITAFAAGVLHHRVHLVPATGVQSARTRRSPFQRRAGLATIALDVAGTRDAPSLYDADVSVARALRNDLPRATATASPAGGV